MRIDSVNGVAESEVAILRNKRERRAIQPMVLAVDDDEDARIIMRRLLKGLGVQFYCAASADEALGVLESIDADIVFSDICMPGKDGLAFAREVRSSRHDVVMIALSSMPEDLSRSPALRAGFDLYMEKPIDSRQLENVLKLDRHRLGEIRKIFNAG